MRSFLAGVCGLALMILAPAHHALAQSQNQTPAASQKQATQPAEDAPADGDDAAPADDAAGPDDSAGNDEQKQAPIPFEGGQLTITQTEEYGEKTLSFDGRELASNYDVAFDKIVKLGDVNVALFDVGDGGNACGPATVIVWKPEGGDIQNVEVEQDNCGSPPAAVAPSAIYFVPYLMPGGTGVAQQWSPQDGLTTSGKLTYMPEPGTGWKDLDPSKYQNIIDAFHNEAVYRAAQKLLGKDLTDVATSLLVGGGTETTKSGAFYASGCVPHDCGGNDGFMAVDPKAKKLYFAQRSGDRAWPALKTWPAEIRAALDKSFQ